MSVGHDGWQRTQHMGHEHDVAAALQAITTVAGTKFHSQTTGLVGSVFSNATMKEVLEQTAGGGGYATVGRYVAAALLNSAAGKTPYLTEPMVRRMWNDMLSQGYFEPTAGVRWGAAEITAYLRSTMR